MALVSPVDSEAEEGDGLSFSSRRLPTRTGQGDSGKRRKGRNHQDPSNDGEDGSMLMREGSSCEPFPALAPNEEASAPSAATTCFASTFLPYDVVLHMYSFIPDLYSIRSAAFVCRTWSSAAVEERRNREAWFWAELLLTRLLVEKLWDHMCATGAAKFASGGESDFYAAEKNLRQNLTIEIHAYAIPSNRFCAAPDIKRAKEVVDLLKDGIWTGYPHSEITSECPTLLFEFGHTYYHTLALLLGGRSDINRSTDTFLGHLAREFGMSRRQQVLAESVAAGGSWDGASIAEDDHDLQELFSYQNSDTETITEVFNRRLELRYLTKTERMSCFQHCMWRHGLGTSSARAERTPFQSELRFPPSPATSGSIAPGVAPRAGESAGGNRAKKLWDDLLHLTEIGPDTSSRDLPQEDPPDEETLRFRQLFAAMARLSPTAFEDLQFYKFIRPGDTSSVSPSTPLPQPQPRVARTITERSVFMKLAAAASTYSRSSVAPNLKRSRPLQDCLLRFAIKRQIVQPFANDHVSNDLSQNLFPNSARGLIRLLCDAHADEPKFDAPTEWVDSYPIWVHRKYCNSRKFIRFAGTTESLRLFAYGYLSRLRFGKEPESVEGEKGEGDEPVPFTSSHNGAVTARRDDLVGDVEERREADYPQPPPTSSISFGFLRRCHPVDVVGFLILACVSRYDAYIECGSELLCGVVPRILRHWTTMKMSYLQGQKRSHTPSESSQPEKADDVPMPVAREGGFREPVPSGLRKDDDGDEAREGEGSEEEEEQVGDTDPPCVIISDPFYAFETEDWIGRWFLVNHHRRRMLIRGLTVLGPWLKDFFGPSEVAYLTKRKERRLLEAVLR
jgi:hypothetical protein